MVAVVVAVAVVVVEAMAVTSTLGRIVMRTFSPGLSGRTLGRQLNSVSSPARVRVFAVVHGLLINITVLEFTHVYVLEYSSPARVLESFNRATGLTQIAEEIHAPDRAAQGTGEGG